MKYRNYKVLIINGQEEYYPCNTSGLMEPLTKMIFESNKKYLIKKNIKFKVIQRKYETHIDIKVAESYDKNLVCLKPLMKKPCATCPFKKDRNEIFQNIELASAVISRNLFKSQQVCHHPKITGKEETHRCRGYFDYSEEIYSRIGLDTNKLFVNTTI